MEEEVVAKRGEVLNGVEQVQDLSKDWGER